MRGALHGRSRFEICRSVSELGLQQQQQLMDSVENSVIKTLGWWQNSAYLLYVQIPLEHLTELLKLVAEVSC